MIRGCEMGTTKKKESKRAAKGAKTRSGGM